MGVVEATTPTRREDALAVRHEVFVEGQGVPEDLEVDEHDEDPGTAHFVAYDGDRAVGAARVRPYGKDGEGRLAKVERVAVREDSRGEGWGRRLMAAVEERAREWGVAAVVLGSQVHAVPFYERLGYRIVDDEPYLDAGIPHREMRKELSGGG